MAVSSRYHAVNFGFPDLFLSDLHPPEALFSVGCLRDAVKQTDLVMLSEALEKVKKAQRFGPEIHEGEVPHRWVHAEEPRAAEAEQLPRGEGFGGCFGVSSL